MKVKMTMTMTRDDVYEMYEGLVFHQPETDFMDKLIEMLVISVVILAALVVLLIFSQWFPPALPIGGTLVFCILLLILFMSNLKENLDEQARIEQTYHVAREDVIERHIPTLDRESYEVKEIVFLSSEGLKEEGPVPVRLTYVREGALFEFQEEVSIRYEAIQTPELSFYHLKEDIVYPDYIPDDYVVKAGYYHVTLSLPEKEKEKGYE